MVDDPRNPSRPAGASTPGIRAALLRWLYPHAFLAAATFLLGAVGGAGAMAATDPVALAAAADAYGSPALFPDRLTTWTVFANNVVALGVLALGCVSFGLAAVVGLAFNGLVLGAVVYLGATAGDPLWTLALILPHGVIELGAFVVVGGIGRRRSDEQRRGEAEEDPRRDDDPDDDAGPAGLQVARGGDRVGPDPRRPQRHHQPERAVGEAERARRHSPGELPGLPRVRQRELAAGQEDERDGAADDRREDPGEEPPADEREEVAERSLAVERDREEVERQRVDEPDDERGRGADQRADG
jgi:hypothetical protein